MFLSGLIVITEMHAISEIDACTLSFCSVKDEKDVGADAKKNDDDDDVVPLDRYETGCALDVLTSKRPR